jgi:hypothetical protein
LFKEAVCDSDHYLVMAKVKRLTVSKQRLQRFHIERFNLKKLNKIASKEKYCVEVSVRFATLDELNTEVDINNAWETIRTSNFRQ